MARFRSNHRPTGKTVFEEPTTSNIAKNGGKKRTSFISESVKIRRAKCTVRRMFDVFLMTFDLPRFLTACLFAQRLLSLSLSPFANTRSDSEKPCKSISNFVSVPSRASVDSHVFLGPPIFLGLCYEIDVRTCHFFASTLTKEREQHLTFSRLLILQPWLA